MDSVNSFLDLLTAECLLMDIGLITGCMCGSSIGSM